MIIGFRAELMCGPTKIPGESLYEHKLGKSEVECGERSTKVTRVTSFKV
jgi:hypothetical protein